MLSDCIHYTLSETQFNIIHIMRRNRFRFRAATQHFAAMRRLTPPRKNGGGANAKVHPTHPRKKISHAPTI